jgi:hypothetical protein
MRILIRILLAAGILCLAMNLIGVVVAYYSSMHELSQGGDTAVDVLAARAEQAKDRPWSALGWTVLGITLIATAMGLWVARRFRRQK